ncbi:MAG: hypothetical protein AAFO96_03025 [Bacteroidota bacterium]
MVKYLLSFIYWAFSFLPFFFGQEPYSFLDYYGEDPSSTIQFFQNQGQVTNLDGEVVPSILYYSKNSHPEVYIGGNTLSLVAQEPETDSTSRLHRVDLWHYQSEGWSPPLATEPTPTQHNFFFPHCGPNGITRVQGYRRVTLENIYPGIDLQVYSNANGLKFYYIIEPGVSPSLLKIQAVGVDSLVVDPTFAEMYLGSYKLILPQVIAYQMDSGNQPQLINPPVIYQDEGNDIIGFHIAGYDPNKHLILSISLPVNSNLPSIPQATENLCWSTYHGYGDNFPGSDDDESQLVKTDQAGNVFVAGDTDSFAFPTVVGTTFGLNKSKFGEKDVYVAKFDSVGVNRAGTYYGGSSFERVLDMCITSSGEVTLCGFTRSSDLDFDLFPYRGGIDGFLVKLDNNLSTLVWKTYIGGQASDECYALTVTPQGNLVIVGETGSQPNQDFPLNTINAGPNPYNQSNNSGLGDGFIMEFNPNHQLIWSTYFGGPQLDRVTGIASNSQNDLYLVGITGSSVPASSNPIANPTPCSAPS